MGAVILYVYSLGYDCGGGLSAPRVFQSLVLAKFHAEAEALGHRIVPEPPDYYSIWECELNGDRLKHHQALFARSRALVWETA